MKSTPWLPAGCFALVLVGIVAALLAAFLPGGFQFGLEEAPGGKISVAAIRKESEVFARIPPATSGSARESKNAPPHRVFVSRTLVFLPEENQEEPVQPLRPEMVTSDGIQVGWKQSYDFDPADPDVPNLDADGDGFTNLEEFQAKTDPRDRQSSPAKESKLRSQSGEPVGLQVSFTAKSGGVFTLRFQVEKQRNEIKVAPGKELWVFYEGGRLEVLEALAKADQLGKTSREAGGAGHGIPLQLVAYEEKIEKVKDASAGGIEVEIDNSFLLLMRKDAVERKEKLFLSTLQKPRPLAWDVGDIRLFTPVEGGKQIGPYRVGQAFEYEGKKFSIVGRQGAKIELAGEDGKTFWVPPEASLGVGKPLGR